MVTAQPGSKSPYLLLSALRHRAAELGDQAVYLQVDTYDEALEQVDGPLSVVQPTSYSADRFVRSRGLEVVADDRGFATTREDFAGWVQGRKRLLMEDFYRWQRLRLDLLMDGVEPSGGQWNLDHDNREPPPKRATLGVTEPWWPTEDDIDAQVREDLDRWQRDGVADFIGADGPRWAPVTRDEASTALAHFVEHRLADFGPSEDAMLSADPWMAHSALSPAINLGPLECARAAEQAYRDGTAPLNSVEGYVRQVIGWREWIWSIYWHVPADYRGRNALDAHGELPEWFASLDAAGEVTANCLSSVLTDLRERGWVHHIPRLMVLGDMGEVGNQGALFHRQAGEYAQALGIENLFTLGELCASTSNAHPHTRHFADMPGLIGAVLGALDQSYSVLVKGSRFMQMERVVQAVTACAQKAQKEVHAL